MKYWAWEGYKNQNTKFTFFCQGSKHYLSYWGEKKEEKEEEQTSLLTNGTCRHEPKDNSNSGPLSWQLEFHGPTHLQG